MRFLVLVLGLVMVGQGFWGLKNLGAAPNPPETLAFKSLNPSTRSENLGGEKAWAEPSLTLPDDSLAKSSPSSDSLPRDSFAKSRPSPDSLPGDPFAKSSPSQDSLPGDPFASSNSSSTLPGDPFAAQPAQTKAKDQARSSLALTFGGYLESRDRFSTTGAPPVALTLTSFFELSAKKGPFSLYGSFKGVFEGAARYWPNGHQALKAGVQELYLSYDQEVVDLWFGRKIHRWGAADGYNPMDLFNPLDSSDPIASGRFLNRVPKWLGGVNLALGPINIEAVYLPRPEVVALPEPGEPWEPRSYRELRRARDQGLLTLTRRSPTRRWNQKGEVGLKLATVLAGWDLAAMAYRGYFDEPLFRVGLSPFGLMASGEYVNFRAYGLSFAKGVGAATIRGEAVVKPDYPVQGPLNWSRGRLIQTVLGWDRDFDGFFYLNLQVFLEFQNKTASKAKEDRQGLTYEASFKWSLDEWAAGARGQIYLTGEGALNELFLEWRFDDHWKFSLGTMVFSGAKTGLLGQYRDNDNAYITLRYSF